MSKTDLAQKRCKRCGATKQLDQFVRHADYADGHMNICKECRNRSGSTRTGPR